LVAIDAETEPAMEPFAAGKVPRFAKKISYVAEKT